jgi:catechol 2,3-dioxygenase-like lactoylglutathione lyase family enzyme
MTEDARFGYTGLGVKNLDRAIEFFTTTLGMTLRSRVDGGWNRGTFANLGFEGEDHYLELNWYDESSPHYTEFTEGDRLDHLGIRVADFEGTLRRLSDAGYPVQIGPTHEGKRHVAFVEAYEGIWLDVYKVDSD